MSGGSTRSGVRGEVGGEAPLGPVPTPSDHLTLSRFAPDPGRVDGSRRSGRQRGVEGGALGPGRDGDGGGVGGAGGRDGPSRVPTLSTA